MSKVMLALIYGAVAGILAIEAITITKIAVKNLEPFVDIDKDVCTWSKKA